MLKHLLIIICFTFLVKVIKASTGEYGILAAESSTEKENFCIIYFKEFVPLPEEKSDAEFHPIQNASTTNFCDDSIPSEPDEFKNKILLAFRHNCSVSEQATNAQEHGGKALLFITPNGRVADVPINTTLAKEVNISVGLVSEKSFERLKTMGYLVTGRIFAPYSMNFDFSLLVIWVIAMFAVTAGSYWSGHTRFAIYCKEMSLLPGGTERELSNKPRVKANTNEDSSINVSPYYIGGLVLSMGGMLLLLYFFFEYLVYVIIGLFVLACILAIYSCLEPLVLKIPGNYCKVSDVGLGNMCHNVDFRKLLLSAFSIGVCVWWLIIRKQKYAWILQDILGVAFCIHMLRSVRLPSLKICTVLLVLLFFYDIFFVFVTPFLTIKGDSVMEEVATGGKSEESLPMVLRVAHLGLDALAICYQQYSILGFGDILVPGLLISYCYGFDLITNKKMLYFPITVTAYGIGLLVTFVGLFWMNTAQPALLYLVPCTLIPPVLIGWCRGELNLLWSGFKGIRATEAAKLPDVQIANIAASAEAVDQRAVFVESGGQSVDVPKVTEVAGEKKHLLK